MPNILTMAVGDERAELLGPMSETTERGHNRVRRERVAVALVVLVLTLAGVFSVLAGYSVGASPMESKLGNRNSVHRVDDAPKVMHASSTKTLEAPHKTLRKSKQVTATHVESKKAKSANAVPATYATVATLGEQPESMHIEIPTTFVHTAVADLRKREADAAKVAGEAVGGLGDGAVTDTSGTVTDQSDVQAGTDTLNTDVYAIMLGGADPVQLDTKDADHKVDVVGHLGSVFSVDSVANNAKLTPGVVAAEWPTDESYPEYALKDVRKLVEERVRKEMAEDDDSTTEISDEDLSAKVDDTMEKLPWIDHFTKRNADGTLLRDDHWPENFDHHVGCLFAHMVVWQLAKDKQAALGDSPVTPTSVVFESDGAAAANLAVPFESLQFAIEQAPTDFDILFVNKLEDPELDTRFPWRSDRVSTQVDPNNQKTIDFFRYRNPYAAGISGYVIGNKFLEKIQQRIADQGADMVDAWLYKLCGDEVDSNEKDKTFLRCYTAIDRKILDRVREEHPEGP